MTEKARLENKGMENELHGKLQKMRTLENDIKDTAG